MARARKDSSEERRRWGSPWKWLVQLVLPLSAGAGLVAGVLVLAGLARDGLRQRGDHFVAFADIDCQPPPGLSRSAFLEEAQYLADLPDQLDLLADDTTARLERGLAAHPWVARVRRVERLVRGLRAELEYRQPVLWVPRPGRAVDGDGVLLPASADRSGLPVLTGRVRAPANQAGQPWGSPAVAAAARVAALLRSSAAVALDGATIEVAGGVVSVRTKQARIVWGRPPGEEQPGEPDAQAKVERLRRAKGAEIDLSQ
jgi:hypothetical protein